MEAMPAMTSCGYQLSQEQVDSILSLTKQPLFHTAHLVQRAVSVGVPKKGTGEHWNRSPAKQSAAMVIQKLKREGVVRSSRPGVWVRVSEAA